MIFEGAMPSGLLLEDFVDGAIVNPLYTYPVYRICTTVRKPSSLKS